ncbi:hypothetical protein GCM10022226_43650 [Sphaerisporangium flaviroseum]|uniref:Uncharacterized protein n=1 Tax=Sphaerisporangium flaviroseum TaxID=509199 RepID=A0ABP7IH86_9ACTN
MIATVAAALSAAVSAMVVDAAQSGLAKLSEPKDPFGWTVQIIDPEGYPRGPNGCFWAFSEIPPDKFPLPDVSQTDWGVLPKGATGGWATQVSISLQGYTSKVVALQRMRVVVTRVVRSSGFMYDIVTGCGGAIEERMYAVDLDKRQPSASPLPNKKWDEETEKWLPAPPVQFPYEVSSEEIEIFNIIASTASCDCRWHIELDWSSEGRSGTAVVNLRGNEFRTVGGDGLPRYRLPLQRDRIKDWIPKP